MLLFYIHNLNRAFVGTSYKMHYKTLHIVDKFIFNTYNKILANSLKMTYFSVKIWDTFNLRILKER